MRIGKFEHNPSVIIVLLYLLFLAALLSLGTWQMVRAAEKTAILSAAAESRDTQAVSPGQIADVEQAAREHTQVSVQGAYVGERQFLWDNRVHKGQAGFEVITPVRTASGLVLVNRGWVPPGLTRQDLPDVAISSELRSAAVTITGLFSRPSKGFASGAAFDSSGPWPRVLQYFDYEAMQSALEAPMLAGVIQPQTKSDAADATSAEIESGFYIANWEPAASIGPMRHYGYAFQWYAMAAALTVLYMVYNTRRIESI